MFLSGLVLFSLSFLLYERPQGLPINFYACPRGGLGVADLWQTVAYGCPCSGPGMAKKWPIVAYGLPCSGPGMAKKWPIVAYGGLCYFCHPLVLGMPTPCHGDASAELQMCYLFLFCFLCV